MHFSPCGWFCFEEPSGWTAEDTPCATILYPLSGAGSIELTSARKESHVTEEETLENHESIIREGFLPRKETTVTQIASGTYIRTLCSNGSRVEIYIHIFWTHYCIYIELKSPLDSHISSKLDALDQLIKSIQPLTVD